MTETEKIKYEKLKEKSAPYKALIFDVDGTLADNMHAHKAAYVAAALEHGIQLDDRIIDETAGWPTVAVAEEIAKRYAVNFDFELFSKRKSTIFIANFIQDTQPIDYVRNILFENVGIKKIGLVSGGSRSTLEITLDVIQVHGKYEALICAGDTERGKPYADPFLLCAEKLQVDPKDCIVFEDGDPGVQGAIAAGMAWVRIDQI